MHEREVEGASHLELYLKILEYPEVGWIRKIGLQMLQMKREVMVEFRIDELKAVRV